MNTYVVSDIHITFNRIIDDKIAINSLMDFIDSIKSKCDELIINGDFIDYRSMEDFERNCNVEPYYSFFESLREFSKKRKITYILGNHDRLIHKNKKIIKFLEDKGIKIPKNPYSYDKIIDSKVFRFEHGNQFESYCRYEDMSDSKETPLSDHAVSMLPYSEENTWINDSWKFRPQNELGQWILSKFFYINSSKLLRMFILPFFGLWTITKLLPIILLILYILQKRLFIDLNLKIALILIGIIAIADFTLFGLAFIYKRILFDLKRLFVTLNSNPLEVGSKRNGDFQKNIELALEDPKKSWLQNKEDYDVLICGHTHEPEFKTKKRIYVNSGCWIKNYEKVKSKLKLPGVYIEYFALNYLVIDKENQIISGKSVVPYHKPNLSPFEKFSLMNKQGKILQKLTPKENIFTLSYNNLF